MQWSPSNTCFFFFLFSLSFLSLGFKSHLVGCLGSRRGVSPIMAYTGRLRPKGVSLFRLQVHESGGILLFEVYERVLKSVIWVC